MTNVWRAQICVAKCWIGFPTLGRIVLLSFFPFLFTWEIFKSVFVILWFCGWENAIFHDAVAVCTKDFLLLRFTRRQSFFLSCCGTVSRVASCIQTHKKPLDVSCNLFHLKDCRAIECHSLIIIMNRRNLLTRSFNGSW